MSKTTETDGGGIEHAPTNGLKARYLQAENRNVPADMIGDRYKKAHEIAKGDKSILEATKQLDRINAPYSCPRCESEKVFYTRRWAIAMCDGCGATIKENPETHTPEKVI